VERRQKPLRCCQSVNGSTGCRVLKHRTRLSRVSEDRGTPFRDGLKTCCSEISSAQHIIYNTNRAVWRPVSCEKPLSKTHPGAPLPLPRPPKKKINNPPKNVSPSNLPSPVRVPGIDPIGKRPRVDVIKNAPVEPSCHCTGTTTVVRSNQNVTYVIRDTLRTTKRHLKTNRNTIPPPSAMRSRVRAMSQDYQ
jgi:hypothetical protein